MRCIRRQKGEEWSVPFCWKPSEVVLLMAIIVGFTCSAWYVIYPSKTIYCWIAAHLQCGGLQHHPWCLLCDQEMETMHHLLVSCPFSHQVWYEIMSCLRPKSGGKKQNLQCLTLSARASPPSRCLRRGWYGNNTKNVCLTAPNLPSATSSQGSRRKLPCGFVLVPNASEYAGHKHECYLNKTVVQVTNVIWNFFSP